MRKNPGWSWRQVVQQQAASVSMIVGIIFENLGKNPLEEKPQNVPFLYISITALIVAAVLSYTLRFRREVETMRKDMPTDKEPPSFWHKNGHMIRVSWLAYRVLLPGLCIAGIFLNLAAISHLEILSWLAGAALLVAIVADIVGVVLIIIGLCLRTRKRAREQAKEQQATM